MFSFKNMLYGSTEMTMDNKLPISEFIRIRQSHDNPQIKMMILGTEMDLIKEITDPETGMVDLNQFSDMVDLFMYLPNTEKVNDQ